MFSSYGTYVREGKESFLVGMLMVDRPNRCPEEYLQGLRDTFGEVIIGPPMMLNGDRRLLIQMRIEDPLSLGLEEKFGIRLEILEYWHYLPKKADYP